MSNDTTADRAALQRAASLVRPALAAKAYVPALTHVKFAGGWALAYDDVTAIAVRCGAGLECLVPGALLLGGLASFGGKEVLFHRDGDALVMKSGRSRVTLPTLPLEAHPFSFPGDGLGQVEFEADMLRAVERCLVSVNTDPKHPAQGGVTLDADDSGRAVMYSTDNRTVSRAQCKTRVKLPGGAPVIMPKGFCEQAVALTKAHEDCVATLFIGNGWLEIDWEPPKGGAPQARLFTRMPVDVDPMDYPRIVQRHAGDVSTVKKRLSTIPDEFDGALGRAVLVLGGEVRKKATLKVDDGTLRIRATSDLGDSDDSMKFDADDAGPVTVEADLLARGLRGASLMGINESVTVLADADAEFVHLVAHVREAK